MGEEMTLFKGVHHVGVGVSDMEKSMQFYGDILGFNQVEFDYSGPLPGMEKITGKPETNARVVMLSSENTSPISFGQIKLVHLLPPDKPGPMPEGLGWGEVGVSEAAIGVQVLDDVHDDLVNNKGLKVILPTEWYPAPPFGIDTGLWYTEDPDGGKIEFIEWRGAFAGFQKKPRIDGVTHVGFGVSNMDRSLDYYRQLGFGEVLFELDDVFESMNHWYSGPPPRQHMVMVANYYGAGAEIVQHTPASKDCRGTWGHVGPMDFSIGVSNLEEACEYVQKNGVELLGAPQTIQLPNGEWRYVFIGEPDGNYVSLIEARF
jgi:catechol 2,3-dioxygenase-like lactoylglutathione lyase family enzyme